MLLLNTILIVGLLLGVGRAMLERRRQRQISIVPTCRWPSRNGGIQRWRNHAGIH